MVSATSAALCFLKGERQRPYLANRAEGQNFSASIPLGNALKPFQTRGFS